MGDLSPKLSDHKVPPRRGLSVPHMMAGAVSTGGASLMEPMFSPRWWGVVLVLNVVTFAGASVYAAVVHR